MTGGADSGTPGSIWRGKRDRWCLFRDTGLGSVGQAPLSQLSAIKFWQKPGARRAFPQSPPQRPDFSRRKSYTPEAVQHPFGSLPIFLPKMIERCYHLAIFAKTIDNGNGHDNSAP